MVGLSIKAQCHRTAYYPGDVVKCTISMIVDESLPNNNNSGGGGGRAGHNTDSKKYSSSTQGDLDLSSSFLEAGGGVSSSSSSLVDVSSKWALFNDKATTVAGGRGGEGARGGGKMAHQRSMSEVVRIEGYDENSSAVGSHNDPMMEVERRPSSSSSSDKPVTTPILLVQQMRLQVLGACTIDSTRVSPEDFVSATFPTSPSSCGKGVDGGEDHNNWDWVPESPSSSGSNKNSKSYYFLQSPSVTPTDINKQQTSFAAPSRGGETSTVAGQKKSYYLPSNTAASTTTTGGSSTLPPVAVLTPGDGKKVAVMRYVLPDSLPPSHKGQTVRFLYHVNIGVQFKVKSGGGGNGGSASSSGAGGGDIKLLTLRVPIKVFSPSSLCRSLRPPYAPPLSYSVSKGRRTGAGGCNNIECFFLPSQSSPALASPLSNAILTRDTTAGADKFVGGGGGGGSPHLNPGREYLLSTLRSRLSTLATPSETLIRYENHPILKVFTASTAAQLGETVHGSFILPDRHLLGDYRCLEAVIQVEQYEVVPKKLFHHAAVIPATAISGIDWREANRAGQVFSIVSPSSEGVVSGGGNAGLNHSSSAGGFETFATPQRKPEASARDMPSEIPGGGDPVSIIDGKNLLHFKPEDVVVCSTKVVEEKQYFLAQHTDFPFSIPIHASKFTPTFYTEAVSLLWVIRFKFFCCKTSEWETIFSPTSSNTVYASGVGVNTMKTDLGSAKRAEKTQIKNVVSQEWSVPLVVSPPLPNSTSSTQLSTEGLSGGGPAETMMNPVQQIIASAGGKLFGGAQASSSISRAHHHHQQDGATTAGRSSSSSYSGSDGHLGEPHFASAS